jgi:hypothetical protein
VPLTPVKTGISRSLADSLPPQVRPRKCSDSTASQADSPSSQMMAWIRTVATCGRLQLKGLDAEAARSTGVRQSTCDDGIMTRVSDELRRLTEDLFLAEAETIGQRLRDVPLPPAVPVVLSVVQAGPVGQWSVTTHTQMINVLRIPQIATRIAPWLSDAELARVGRCAAKIVDSARETLPFWAVFGGQPLAVFTKAQNISEVPRPDYSSDPGGWVARFVLLPALQHHLVTLPSITDADQAAASTFADEVLEVAHNDRLRYRLVVPLFPEVAVEFEVSSQRDAAFELNPGPVPSLVGALQLHGYWVAGRFYQVQSEPPWLFPVRQQVPFTVPGIVDGRSVLAAEGFVASLATAKVLAGYGITQPRSPKDLALDRFFAGVARQGVSDFLPGGAHRNAADAVLDFTIALLLPYDEKARHGDLGYRFRMHGAHFLADEREQRSALARRLGGIYEVRSRLVHGGKYPSLDEIQSTRSDARDLARRGLLRAVHEGFPTAGAFNRMVLGTE